jgi:hypothetical protein
VRPRTGCYPDEEFLELQRLEQQVPPWLQVLVHLGLPVLQVQLTEVQPVPPESLKLEQLELELEPKELPEPLP